MAQDKNLNDHKIDLQEVLDKTWDLQKNTREHVKGLKEDLDSTSKIVDETDKKADDAITKADDAKTKADAANSIATQNKTNITKLQNASAFVFGDISVKAERDELLALNEGATFSFQAIPPGETTLQHFTGIVEHSDHTAAHFMASVEYISGAQANEKVLRTLDFQDTTSSTSMLHDRVDLKIRSAVVGAHSQFRPPSDLSVLPKKEIADLIKATTVSVEATKDWLHDNLATITDAGTPLTSAGAQYLATQIFDYIRNSILETNIYMRIVNSDVLFSEDIDGEEVINFPFNVSWDGHKLIYSIGDYQEVIGKYIDLKFIGMSDASSAKVDKVIHKIYDTDDPTNILHTQESATSRSNQGNIFRLYELQSSLKGSPETQKRIMKLDVYNNNDDELNVFTNSFDIADRISLSTEIQFHPLIEAPAGQHATGDIYKLLISTGSKLSVELLWSKIVNYVNSEIQKHLNAIGANSNSHIFTSGKVGDYKSQIEHAVKNGQPVNLVEGWSGGGKNWFMAHEFRQIDESGSEVFFTKFNTRDNDIVLNDFHDQTLSPFRTTGTTNTFTLVIGGSSGASASVADGKMVITGSGNVALKDLDASDLLVAKSYADQHNGTQRFFTENTYAEFATKYANGEYPKPSRIAIMTFGIPITIPGLNNGQPVVIPADHSGYVNILDDAAAVDYKHPLSIDISGYSSLERALDISNSQEDASKVSTGYVDLTSDIKGSLSNSNKTLTFVVSEDEPSGSHINFLSFITLVGESPGLVANQLAHRIIHTHVDGIVPNAVAFGATLFNAHIHTVKSGGILTLTITKSDDSAWDITHDFYLSKFQRISLPHVIPVGTISNEQIQHVAITDHGVGLTNKGIHHITIDKVVSGEVALKDIMKIEVPFAWAPEMVGFFESYSAPEVEFPFVEVELKRINFKLVHNTRHFHETFANSITYTNDRDVKFNITTTGVWTNTQQVDPDAPDILPYFRITLKESAIGATKSLSNVNVGAGHSGTFARVKADGQLEWIAEVSKAFTEVPSIADMNANTSMPDGTIVGNAQDNNFYIWVDVDHKWELHKDSGGVGGYAGQTKALFSEYVYNILRNNEGQEYDESKIASHYKGDLTISEDSTGTLEIGSRSWVPDDGKGIIVHGGKVATFEQIIEKVLEPKTHTSGSTTGPKWKDITATYKTRDYTYDLGKQFKITFDTLNMDVDIPGNGQTFPQINKNFNKVIFTLDMISLDGFFRTSIKNMARNLDGSFMEVQSLFWNYDDIGYIWHAVQDNNHSSEKWLLDAKLEVSKVEVFE